MADFITNLPLEVIQQIASLCSLRDVVSLSWTCRKLRPLCHDHFVLQWCFLNQIHGPIAKHLADKEALRKLIATRLASRPTDDAALVWVRLAATASNLPDFLDELEERLLPFESVRWDGSGGPEMSLQTLGAVTNTVAMLSTWTVLCSPTVNNFSLTASLAGWITHTILGEEWSRPTFVLDAAQLSFCFAMGILGNTVLNMSIMARGAMDLQNPDVWRENRIREHLKLSFIGNQVIAFITLGCLPWILRSDPGVQIRDDLPKPEELPLLRESGIIPLPDAPVPQNHASAAVFRALSRNLQRMEPSTYASSWSLWLRGNVDGHIDEIADGEWMGYVSTSQGRSGDVPAPAQGVNFTAHPDPEDPNRLSMVGENGVDARGPFRLDGYVDRPLAMVYLTKRWVDTTFPAHVLRGVVTPLGIAGVWAYQRTPGIPMGFMWMYKKEWTRARPRPLPMFSAA